MWRRKSDPSDIKEALGSGLALSPEGTIFGYWWFVVSTGQKVAYVYFEDEPGRPSAAKLLTRDEWRRIVVNIAKLLELLKRRAKLPELLAGAVN